MTYSCPKGLLKPLKNHGLMMSQSTIFKTPDSLKNSAIHIKNCGVIYSFIREYIDLHGTDKNRGIRANHGQNKEYFGH